MTAERNIISQTLLAVVSLVMAIFFARRVSNADLLINSLSSNGYRYRWTYQDCCNTGGLVASSLLVVLSVDPVSIWDLYSPFVRLWLSYNITTALAIAAISVAFITARTYVLIALPQGEDQVASARKGAIALSVVLFLGTQVWATLSAFESDQFLIEGSYLVFLASLETAGILLFVCVIIRLIKLISDHSAAHGELVARSQDNRLQEHALVRLRRLLQLWVAIYLLCAVPQMYFGLTSLGDEKKPVGEGGSDVYVLSDWIFTWVQVGVVLACAIGGKAAPPPSTKKPLEFSNISSARRSASGGSTDGLPSEVSA